MAPITKGLLMLTTRRINRTVSGNPAPLATLLVGLALLPLSIGSAAPPDIKAQATHDGLAPIKVKGIDQAYAAPGATLAAYRKVIIDPVEVSFRKDWKPNRTGSTFPLDVKDREAIRTGVAKLVREEFARELQTKSRYQVVEAAGPDVLRVKADIVDLYVNAPESRESTLTHTYVISAGEMTLVGALYDSESGSIIARVVDRQESRGTGQLMLTNSLINEMEARRSAAHWARILRTRLDSAQAIGKP